MQKGKRFFYVLATLLAIMPIASCKMDGGDIKAASIEIEKEQTKGNTLIIRTNVSTQEQTTTNSRSAVPSKLVDTGGNQLVFAGALYASDAQEKDKKFQKGEYNNGSLTLTFESSEEDRIAYTLEIRAYKGGTEDFDGKHLLYGTAPITIEANKTEINAPAIKLKPYEGATEKGKVNLEILIPSEYSLLIEGGEFSPDITDSNEQINEYEKYTISADVEAGIYEVDFSLVNSNDETVYLWSEAINVYPGMTTDKWNSGSVNGDGARQISKASIFSTFYVMGASPSSKWFKDRSVSDTEENGSLSHPFTSIQKAIDKVRTINDESTPFSIYIDGTLTQSAATGNGMADFSTLNKNLTLTIKSLSETAKATLDADKKSRVMYASTAKLNLTLENLIITGGNSTESGGGIYVENSTFKMNNCEIKDNTTNAGTYAGGGIYISNSTLNMNDCIISGNIASSGYGGGISIENGVLTTENCKFSKNFAKSSYGGAFYNTNATLTMTGDIISENEAAICGGVYVDGGTLTMKNCKVESNIATAYEAGGIKVTSGGRLIIEDNTIISGNEVKNSDSNLDAQGGGVYVNDGSFTMNGGTISGSNATLGGGVYVDDGTFTMNGGTIGGNTTDNKNTAQNGGGVYVNSGTLTMNAGATISGNTASQDGGGVYVAAGTFNMHDGTIGGENEDTANTAQNGGGVYVANNSMFTMRGGTIGGENEDTANTAQNGGGVYVANNSMFTMRGGEISNNKAIVGNLAYNGQGGGVYVNSATFKISGTAKIIGNKAAKSGGGIYVYKDNENTTHSMTGGEISGNEAVNNGAGVYINGGTFTITDGEISGNTATNSGGGVYNKDGKITMSGGTISSNTATKDGGGVYIESGTFEISDTATISECTATPSNSGDGGGVYVTGSTSNFTMSGDTITGNTATNSGGGVFVYSGTFTMSGSASIPAGNDGKNDVYLSNGKTIAVADGLAATTPVATITLSNSAYTLGKQVLSAGTGVTIDQTVCDKFAVTPQADGTKWKVALSGNTGVLEKDNVSPDDNSGNGISVTIDGVGTYTFKLEAGNTEVTKDSTLQPGTSIKLSEVKDSSRNALTASDGTFSIEIRDESEITYPDASASATGFQCTATVPQVPPDGMPAQIYVKVELNDSKTVIDKTISVKIMPQDVNN